MRQHSEASVTVTKTVRVSRKAGRRRYTGMRRAQKGATRTHSRISRIAIGLRRMLWNPIMRRRFTGIRKPQIRGISARRIISVSAINWGLV